MTLENDALGKPHICRHFDGELATIYKLVLDMISLIREQWELVIEAMEDANLESALDIVAQTGDVHRYESRIDQAILILLAKESPVAIDLRMMLSISKIAAVMKYLGDEVDDMATLILALYEPRNGTPNARLVTDIVKISQGIRAVLADLTADLSRLDSSQARRVLQLDCNSDKHIQDAFKRQLTFINKDFRQIRPALTVLQIIKSLESSSDHCKNLAEYCIFMIDGQDLRHVGRLPLAD